MRGTRRCAKTRRSSIVVITLMGLPLVGKRGC
jgi:hypothetical protein